MNKAHCVDCMGLTLKEKCLMRQTIKFYQSEDSKVINLFCFFALNNPIFNAAIGGFAKVLTIMAPNMKSDYPNLN